MHSAEIGRSALRTTTAAAIAAAAAYGVVTLLGFDSSSGAWLRAIPATLGGITFAAVFLPVAALVKSDELNTIARPVMARLGRKG